MTVRLVETISVHLVEVDGHLARGKNSTGCTDTVGKVCTRYRYFGHFNTYRTDLIRYSRVSYPRYPRIPRYFRFPIPTVPAKSGIFESHTYDTHDTPVFPDDDTYRTGKIRHFQASYPRYPRIPRYFRISIPTVPAWSGIFSGIIPTIPTIPRYSKISVPTVPA